MANILTTLDAEGIPVYLRDSTWRNHVLKRHQELGRRLGAIALTVAKPHRSYDNTDYPNGVSYWRRIQVGRRVHPVWLTVVVNYKRARISRREYGEIVTAYFALETPDERLRIDNDS